MGAQFSKGFVPRELRCHVERPLLRVKALFDTFKRLCREDFVIYYLKNENMVEIFLICYMKN